MSKPAILNRIFWATGTAGALLVCYLLCGHIFYELHGNKDWSLAMFILGLAVIFISAFFGAKRVMVCTTVGYVISFIAGIVFNFEYDFFVDGVLQDRRYSAWQIWTVSFLVLIFAGIAWEFIGKRIRKHKTTLTVK